MKEVVAKVLAKRVKDGEVIGIGSGSTVELAVKELAARIKNEKLQVHGIPTSQRTALLCAEAGICVLSPVATHHISWAFDGADELDPALNMIKGGGGAMLNEKIVAKKADLFVVIISEDKLVEKLGSKFAVPVETIPEAMEMVRAGLEALGAKTVELRNAERKYGPVTTEHANVILDARFEEIGPDLEKEINCLTGVVDNGLFMGMYPEVLIAKTDGVWKRIFDGTAVTEEKLE